MIQNFVCKGKKKSLHNYKKYPNTFTTNVGMARALSSEGKYKEALKYASTALSQAPDNMNKTSVESMIEKLKDGKDVNW